MRRFLFLIGALAGAIEPACAQTADVAPGWNTWFADPLVGIALATLFILYLAGLGQMLHHPHQRWPVGKSRVVSFLGGLTIVGAALLSPIDPLSERYFSVHMAQHLFLMLAAAPLLAFSNAHLVLLRALPLSRRRAVGRAIAGTPGVKRAAHSQVAAWSAVTAFVVTLWFWHMPAAYDWALGSDVVHSIEHITLLTAAIAFWRVIVTSGDRRLSTGMAVLLVSLVGIQGAFLSALIMFSAHPLYGAYTQNPLDDQVLAGVLMCIPASFIYLGTTIWALSRMLGSEATRVR